MTSRYTPFTYQLYINDKRIFQALEHDGFGYMRFNDIFTVTEDELTMSGGRFALWSTTSQQYEVAPTIAKGYGRADAIINLIRSTVDWCANNCMGHWHMMIELRDNQTTNDNVFYVSFQQQKDADAYQVCFALNSGHYESSYVV
jgi:hypothetical protein